MKKILIVVFCFFSISFLRLNALVGENKNYEIEDLLNGIVINEEKFVELNGDDIKINKVISNDVNSYFVLGSIENDYRPYQGINETSFPFVLFVENNNVKFLEIYDDVYGSFYDGCLTPRGVALIGYIERDEIDKECYIAEISYKGEKLRDLTLNGEKYDVGLKIYYNDFLYFAVSSNSGLYDYHENDKGLYFGYIKYDTFSLMGLKPTLEKCDKIYDIEYDDKYVYCDITSSRERKLIRYLNDGDCDNYYVMPNGTEMIDFFISNEEVYLYNEKSDNNEMKIERLSKDFNSVEGLKYNCYKKTHEIKTLKVSTLNGNYLFVVKLDPIVQSFGKLLSITLVDNNFNVLKELIVDDEKDNIINVEYNGDVISIYEFLSTENRKMISRRNVAFIEASSFEIEEESYIKRSYNLSLNLNKVELKTNTVDTSKYQNITLTEYYESSLIRVGIPTLYECKGVMNVKDGETYDTGLVLKFNGDAFLNGKKVIDGEMITEEGIYTLKLVNNDGETVASSFIVKNLGTGVVQNSLDNTVAMKRIVIEDDNYETEHQNINYKVTSVEDSVNYSYFIFVGIILGPFFALILFKIKRKKNNV